MTSLANPNGLLRAIAAIGYFDAPTTNQDKLARLLENNLNIGIPRAVDALTKAGLVVFRYSQDPALHPRDQIDHWQLYLTDAGKELLASEP